MAARHHSLRLPPEQAKASLRSGSVSERSENSDDSADTASQKSSGGSHKPNTTRKRASRPKVRTGCISCKKRHVKCDERKPGCSRCENLSLICEGYAAPKTAKQIARMERPLLPRPQLAALAPLAAANSDSHGTLPIPSSPGLGFALSSDDGWYFDLFRNQVAYDLSPCRKANFWTLWCLRGSVNFLSIRHSILGIGAYARALADLRNDQPWVNGVDRPWWPASIYNQHHQAALRHHSKALGYLRQDIKQNGVDNRTTMLATLLFIVFENMQGNYHASGSLVRSAIKVLNNMGSNFLWRTYCKEFSEPDETDEMARLISRHSLSSVLLPFPHGKYAYHMLLQDDVDDDSSDDSLSSASSERIPLRYAVQSTIPRTIEHARIIWESTLPGIGRFYAKAIWRNLNPSYEVDSDTLQEQSRLLMKIQDFEMGVDALLAAERDDTKILVLDFLAMYGLIARIIVSCCLDRSEASYDAYTTEFEVAVTKMQTYSACMTLGNKTGFSNEVGILPLAAFIASKCRVHRLRLIALDLIRTRAAREGPWDGVSLSNAVSHLMQLEGHDDKEATSYMPPADSRFVWTNIFWDFENRKMTIEYTKIPRDEFSDTEKVTRVISS
ncbi:hypothetical protein BX600DRAFT_516138 [Xylariales sp. PMI_506]|nr:hypothetical protein BX600DRAFT_516138 [Xylariales sp. PMI_506]